MKKTRKTVSVLLFFVFVFSTVLGQMPAEREIRAAGYDIKNPVIDENGVTEWDCIYFGSYWKNDTNGDGVADKKDEKEPIRWRVLSVRGDEAFLLADQGLDCQPFHTKNENVTWENCSLRTWMNGTFYQEAFNPEEQSAVRETSILNNEKNPPAGVTGKNTEDKVYLLSTAEAGNDYYGFNPVFAEENKARCCRSTAYAKARGALGSALSGSEDYTGNALWLLRSSTYNADNWLRMVSVVGGSGCGHSSRCAVSDKYSAIRPALHIDLTSDTWSKAGQVDSEEALEEEDTEPSETQKPNPTETPADNNVPEEPKKELQTPNSSEKPSAAVRPPADNTEIKDSAGVTYTVTKSGATGGEVSYAVPKNKKSITVTIPDAVKIKDVTYKVTSLKANAFKNCRRLKKVTIGKNIKKIGKNAFYGCSKLKAVTVKTTKLTNKSVGSRAFAKLDKKAVFRVPKKKLPAYRKMLKKKGVSGKKQTIRK